MDESTKKIIGILALLTAGGIASYEAYKFLTKSTSSSSSTSTSTSGGSGVSPSTGTEPPSTSTTTSSTTSNVGTITLNTAEIKGLEVTITGSATGNPSEIEWEWGDGTISTSNFPATHTYSSTGTYDISVIAVYPSGTANANFSVTLTSSTISSSTSTTTSTSTSTSTTSTLTPSISNVSVDNEGNFTVTGSDFGTQNTGNNLLFPITTFRFRCETESFQAGVIGDVISINVYEWNDTTVEFSLNINGTDWTLPNGSDCFISINNSPLYYFTYNGPSLNESTSTSGQTPTPPPSTCTSGTATGNWLTSAGINWYGAGCYQMPNGTYQYFSTETDLYNYAVSNGYLKTSPLPQGDTNQLGSQSNPYIFDNGYQGAGYYEFTTAEYNKLLSIPASGIKYNPTYMDNQTFYNGVESWLNYNTSSGTSGSSGSSGSTSPSNATNGIITLSSSTISKTNGASVTISGSDFPPNSSGYVTACENEYYAELAGGIELFGFTADANGNFSKTIYYEYSTTNASSLANAFANWNPLYIVAFDYENGTVSSNVEILTGE